MTLKTYMGYDSDPSEGACLIFAHNAREAKKIGWGYINSWGCEEFTDMRVNLIRNENHLFQEADQELLAADKPHVIEAPKCCKHCEKWGVGEIGDDKLCANCRKDMELMELELQHDKEAREYMATRPLPETHPDDALMSLPYDIR